MFSVSATSRCVCAGYPKRPYRRTITVHSRFVSRVSRYSYSCFSCIACAACVHNGNGHCAFNDDLCNEVIDKMNQADGLIVGSPVYYGNPTGNLLNLIHRMLFAGAKVSGKPAAAVAVCRRGGATAAFQTLQTPFQMVNMPLVTSQYWNIAYGREPGEVRLNSEGMQTMRTMALNMAWMIRQLTAEGSQPPKYEPWQGTHFIR